MEEWLDMINDLESRDSKLTDWERMFIDDIARRLGENRGLTTAQDDTLTRIWDRITS